MLRADPGHSRNKHVDFARRRLFDGANFIVGGPNVRSCCLTSISARNQNLMETIPSGDRMQTKA